MPGRKKGTRKTGGRQKGTPNKIGATIRESLIEVFNGLGGVNHMKTWAENNETEFYRILAKLLPKTEPVLIKDLSGTLTEQGEMLLSAMGKGELSPTETTSMLHALAAQARIIEIDELEKRVSELESIQ